LISVGAARTLYGVVIDGEKGVVDEAATAQLRNAGTLKICST
jgi:hypothetical protein